VLAPLAGIALNAAAVLATVGVMALMAFALTNLELIIALAIDSTQGFHAIMNFGPAADLDAFGGVFSRRRRARRARLGDAPGSVDLRDGGPAREPLPGPSGLSLPNLTFPAALTVAFVLVTYLAGTNRQPSRHGVSDCCPLGWKSDKRAQR
jgi:hypothetical protein